FTWNPQSRLWRRFSFGLPIFAALLWSALDALRFETPLAHGWGSLAYTQWSDAALLQTSRWAGQHGLTALCVWFAACLALWLERSSRRRCRLWLAPVTVFTALHLYGAFHLETSQPDSDAPRLRVLLVQTNVPSLSKNFGSSGESALQQAMRLTREGTAREKFDLVVWPETTLNAGRLDLRGAESTTGFGANLSLEMELARRLSRDINTPILFGANTASIGQRRELVNAAILVSPSGKIDASAKSRLVPFGERAPWSDALPFLRRLAPDPPVAFADRVQTLPLETPYGTIRIGALICFESCFRYPARQLQLGGVQALFVLTNDEWFDGTNAPWEHAAMTTLRAAENGVPVAQSVNGGYACAVDPNGRFVLKSSYGRESAWSVDLPLVQSR
ncbi:MAG TPA: apolipoprotein N-acyltransferase, partial [Abditibacteriaceae bacterium]